MQPRVRNALIFLLTLGLLGVFLRSVNVADVWAETRRANPWPLLLAIGVTGVDLRRPCLALAVSAGADRPDPFQHRVPDHGYRFRRHVSVAGPGRRGHSAVSAGAPRGPQRDRRLRDDHPRAAARPDDRAAAVRVVRADRRLPASSRAIRHSSPASSWAGSPAAGAALAGVGGVSSCWRVIPSAWAGWPCASSACCRPGSPRPSRASSRRSRRGWR